MKEYWDDYSQQFPFENIRLVFSNKNSNVNESNDLIDFSKLVGLDPDSLIIINQIHSSNVIKANSPGIYTAADGIINRGGNLVCSIKVADCLPIFFVNNNSKTIGLVHAGWRGLALGILNEFVNKIYLCKENVFDYYVLIGPSIQSCCFEIQDDVLEYFDSNHYNPSSNDKYKVDLQAWAIDQLVCSGLEREKINVINKCTYCLDTLYHSYRRSGTNAGRMYALAGWSS